ncbi:hypothetical protein C1X11_28015, partial [Escherichia coli]|uniref:tetratricopeptide repeat protein n=1 Tax=Escherichia coli TaxID=562 RepID=UPI000CC2E377
GRNDEATALYERAASVNANDLPAALRLGNHYLQINDKQKAQALAQRLLVGNPSSPEVLDFSGQTALVNGDKDGALDTYR